MSILGIAAGPDQIADGKDPSRLAEVDQYGNLSEISKGLGPAGFHKVLRTDAGGKLILSDTELLKAILIEMRIQTQFLAAIAAGQIANDDPDTLRLDADASGFLQTLS